MLENKEQEKIAGIISDFFGGAVNEADIDILAMKIYEKYVAKLEQDLEFTTKTANELIEIKHKLEQEFAELKEKYNKASEKLKNITEEVENNFVHGQDYEKLKQELAELKEKDNYHLRYELAGADETITNLKQQLEEKDKDKTQLAIQELEKVKILLQNAVNYEGYTFVGIYDAVNNQIKELKGE